MHRRNITFVGLAIVALCITAPQVSAQTIVQVAPGFGTLNLAIDGDTTATGERNDPETIYELERDGLYLLDGSIEHEGFHLTIVAAEGSGARPILQPGVVEGGGSSRPFRARADITLRSIYATNRDELGALNTRILRVSADSVRITLDDVHFDEDGQSGIRLDNTDNSIFITNSIFSRIGIHASPDNGRGIDDRGNPIDSLVIQNSTFYNITSNVLRNGGGIINYADINHNTIVNIGQYGLDLGEVITAHVTNNQFINVGYMGTTEFIELDDPDETGRVVVVNPLQSDITATQVMNVRNNNIYIDPLIEAAQPDSVIAASGLVYSSHAMELLEASGTGPTNISEAVAFTNGPADPSSLMLDFYEFGEASTAPWDNTATPYDFLYTGGESASASTGMQPLGSLVWHSQEIADSDRTTPLVDPVDPGDGDGTVTLPVGEEGPGGLDLDTASGNQSVHQTATNPSVGDQISVDVFATEGATDKTGYQASITWDPTALSLVSYSVVGIFPGGLDLGGETDGTYNAAVAILGGSASADAGSVGLATFEVLDGFSGSTTVTLTSLSLEAHGVAANDLAIGPGAAFVVIGGVSGPVIKTADLDDTPGVGFGDFLIFAGGFNTVAGDDRYDERLDLDGNGDVGFGDFLIFAAQFSAG